MIEIKDFSWKDLSFMGENFLNPGVVNLSVCLIFFLAIISVKIEQWPGNFGMFLNYIGLLYAWKIVIVYCISYEHFKNFNTLIFSVNF